MSLNAFEMAAELVQDVFMYNRGNFQYDRTQRQKMEYELAGMRLEQVALWREDVRDFSMLTPKKMEVYLLVTALELGFCIMALCKARVPPGAPSWLVACHTLAVVGALMYLFLALWFGMHAFVSAQAYKVRILTQLVRLPVPTWRALEASRTYGSAFERLDKGQMLRVPFAMGRQEQQAASGRNSQAAGQGPGGAGYGAPQDFGAAGPDVRASADPWGLERRGDGLSELAPDVNAQTERQRHIWLVREAAKFYQTYDAFCRISMSAGTSCLATFFCYFCMTYVLTENAAPTAAWAGMIIFICCALSLLRCDLMLTGWQYFIQGVLSFAGPALSFFVTYQSSKNAGHPGKWKFLIVIALFLHGLTLINYLVLFRVREMQTGAVLPTAFRRVLYIDPFGWAKHTGTWWRQLRTQLMLVRSRSYSLISSMRSMSSMSLNSAGSDGGAEGRSALPTMQCVSSSAPMRPEDVEEAEQVPQSPFRGLPHMSEADQLNISFRPGTFATNVEDAEPASELKGDIQTGTDIHGEKPGLVPWRIFFINTICLAAAWEFAAGVSLVRTIHGRSLFFPAMKNATYGLAPGVVMPIPEMFGVRVTTSFKHGLDRPRGLACDANGTIFLTSARASDGGRGLVHGRLSQPLESGPAVDFGPAQLCPEMGEDHGPIQDLSLHNCTEHGDCHALVLPSRGTHLVSCALAPRDGSAMPEPGAQRPPPLPLGRAWLDDRGGAPPEGGSGDAGLFYPEELSSLGDAPCAPGEASAGKPGCVVVGTTAGRLVHMGVGGGGPSGQKLVPRGLLQDDRGKVPEPGSLAVLGGRYLGTLQRKGSLLQVLDLHRGGTHVGTWRLPSADSGDSDRRWASVCAGDSAFYALEDAHDPALWRFEAPAELRIGVPAGHLAPA